MREAQKVNKKALEFKRNTELSICLLDIISSKHDYGDGLIRDYCIMDNANYMDYIKRECRINPSLEEIHNALEYLVLIEDIGIKYIVSVCGDLILERRIFIIENN